MSRDETERTKGGKDGGGKSEMKENGERERERQVFTGDA